MHYSLWTCKATNEIQTEFKVSGWKDQLKKVWMAAVLHNKTRLKTLAFWKMTKRLKTYEFIRQSAIIQSNSRSSQNWKKAFNLKCQALCPHVHNFDLPKLTLFSQFLTSTPPENVEVLNEGSYRVKKQNKRNSIGKENKENKGY